MTDQRNFSARYREMMEKLGMHNAPMKEDFITFYGYKKGKLIIEAKNRTEIDFSKISVVEEYFDKEKYEYVEEIYNNELFKISTEFYKYTQRHCDNIPVFTTLYGKIFETLRYRGVCMDAGCFEDLMFDIMADISNSYR